MHGAHASASSPSCRAEAGRKYVVFIGGQTGSAQLGDLQAVFLRPLLDRLLAARQRLGDRSERHALAREHVKLLDLVLPPRLPVALEPFTHLALPFRIAHSTQEMGRPGNGRPEAQAVCVRTARPEPGYMPLARFVSASLCVMSFIIMFSVAAFVAMFPSMPPVIAAFSSTITLSVAVAFMSAFAAVLSLRPQAASDSAAQEISKIARISNSLFVWCGGITPGSALFSAHAFAGARPQVYPHAPAKALSRTAEVPMPFALQLRELLGLRERLMPAEFAKGEPLESVLD